MSTANLFINTLQESFEIKDNDYVAFDISDSNTGDFYTKKVSYETLTSKLSADLYISFQNSLSLLQKQLNSTNKLIAFKLDRRGLNYNINERINGPLSINANLTAYYPSHFKAEMDMHNYKIRNLGDPITNFDAANKAYVDAQVISLQDRIPNSSGFLSKVGDSMTSGFLYLASDPQEPLHAATKRYVDGFNAAGVYLPLSGGSLTGSLKLFSNPVLDLEPATKSYVDNKMLLFRVLPLSGGIMEGNVVFKGMSHQYSEIYAAQAEVELNTDTNRVFVLYVDGDITGFKTKGTKIYDAYEIQLVLVQRGIDPYFNVTNWTIDNQKIKFANAYTPALTRETLKTDIFKLKRIANTWYGFIEGMNF